VVAGIAVALAAVAGGGTALVLGSGGSKSTREPAKAADAAPTLPRLPDPCKDPSRYAAAVETLIRQRSVNATPAARRQLRDLKAHARISDCASVSQTFAITATTSRSP